MNHWLLIWSLTLTTITTITTTIKSWCSVLRFDHQRPTPATAPGALTSFCLPGGRRDQSWWLNNAISRVLTRVLPMNTIYITSTCMLIATLIATISYKQLHHGISLGPVTSGHHLHTINWVDNKIISPSFTIYIKVLVCKKNTCVDC